MRYVLKGERMKKELIIPKKKLNAEEYVHFTLRTSNENIEKIEELSAKTNCSRNYIINIFIEYGLDNYEIIE